LSFSKKRGSFSGMSATLTINLDSDVLQLAEQEAKARHTTLPEVVAHQLRVMARNWQDSRSGRTPVTDALRGAVTLPPDFDAQAALTEELQKKHGVQG
jgi:predicted transcriptional regulator